MASVRLIALLKRKPGTTHEEFLEHWRAVHGPLIADSSLTQWVRRYEQHPAAWPPPGSRGPEPEYDGVTIQWFDSVSAFWEHVADPHQVLVNADIQTFLDPAGIQWVLTDDPTVVI